MINNLYSLSTYEDATQHKTCIQKSKECSSTRISRNRPINFISFQLIAH
jgi:hypothetical protein